MRVCEGGVRVCEWGCVSGGVRVEKGCVSEGV